MADPWDDDDDQDGKPDGQQSDSELVKDLRKQLKAKDKEIAGLNDELGGFRTKDRETKVADLLAAHEANPKIARFMPADLELTKEAVGKWLEDEGDVFGYKKPDVDDSPDDPRADALGRIDRVSVDSIPPTKSGDLISRIAGAKTREELDAIVAEQHSRTR